MRRPTKRRTAAARLAWLDQYLCLGRPVELRQIHMVDVGFGANPTTSIETLARLKAWNISLTAVETEPYLVDNAQSGVQADGLSISFRVGDFRLSNCVGVDENVGIIRCANVLRGYREDEVEPAWRSMAEVLREGGVLLDATCDSHGAVGSCLVLRKRQGQLHREALVFHTDFSRGFAPRMFRDVLPRIYRRRAKPRSPLANFFDGWHVISDALSHTSIQRRFEQSVSQHPEMQWLAPGLAHWLPPDGVPGVARLARAGAHPPANRSPWNPTAAARRE